MALRWFEGFEDFASSNLSTHLIRKYTTGSMGNPTIIGGRYSGNGLKAGSSAGDQFIYTPTQTAQQTWITGCAFRISSSISVTRPLLILYSGSNLQSGIWINTNKQIEFRRFTTVVATASSRLRSSRWYFIEMKVVLSNTVGSYEVRVDGINVLSATGVDTCNIVTESADLVRLNWGQALTTSTLFEIDDWYVCDSTGSKDNDFLGDNRIIQLLPTSDDAVQFTPLSGSNWAAVDETPMDDDSSYVEDSTVGHQDTYGFSDTSDLTTIKGVMINAGAKTTASEKIKLITKSGVSGTDASAAKTLSSSYSIQSHLLDSNPDGPADWTQTTLNAARFGVEVSS